MTPIRLRRRPASGALRRVEAPAMPARPTLTPATPERTHARAVTHAVTGVIETIGERGFGFILDDARQFGRLFFNVRSVVKSAVRFDDLRAGDRVTFNVYEADALDAGHLRAGSLRKIA